MMLLISFTGLLWAMGKNSFVGIFFLHPASYADLSNAPVSFRQRQSLEGIIYRIFVKQTYSIRT
jgi:hypothetical protein